MSWSLQIDEQVPGISWRSAEDYEQWGFMHLFSTPQAVRKPCFPSLFFEACFSRPVFQEGDDRTVEGSPLRWRVDDR
jgi:hypothetical protein